MNQQQQTQTGSNQGNKAATYHLKWGNFPKTSALNLCLFYRILSTALDMSPWIYRDGDILVDPDLLDGKRDNEDLQYFIGVGCGNGIIDLTKDEIAMFYETAKLCDVTLQGTIMRVEGACEECESLRCQNEPSEDSP